MSDPGSGSDRPVHVWKRWTDSPNVPFHRYCEFFPWSVSTPVSLGRPWTAIARDAEAAGVERPSVQYTRGKIRAALRYTPLVVLVALLVTLLEAEFATDTYALSDVLAVHTGPVLPFLGIGLVWLALLLVLLRSADLLPGTALLEAVAVYGVLLALLAGTAFSVFTVMTDGPFNPVTSPAYEYNVLFMFSFYLMLFVGGALVYDGMLRTENLFEKLPRKRDTIIREHEDGAYEEFLSAFRGELDASVATVRGRPIRTAHVFAVLFVLPFFVVWHVRDPSPGPVGLLTGVVPALLDVALVVVFFQFLLLVKYFHKLLTDHRPREEPREDPPDPNFTLRYRPKHPDGYAGFRGIGKFATRVNSLLLVGGLYVVVRVYVGGLNALPEGGLATLSPAAINWAFDFLGPVVFYVIAVVVWLYASFWQIHRTMARGRTIAMRDLDEEVAADEEHDRKFQLHRDGPVWPINTRLFLSLVSMDMIPVIGLLPILPF